MVALFVTLAALRRLLGPRELPPRQHAAELLGKSDDGRVQPALQGPLMTTHSARALIRAIWARFA
jgi:hypothetical protein